MGNEVNDFERHFQAQAKGRIPYTSGFTVVGKMPHNLDTRSNTEPTSNNIVTVSPAMAAVEQAVGLVGGRARKGRKSTKKKKKKVKTAGNVKKRKSSSYRKRYGIGGDAHSKKKKKKKKNSERRKEAI